MINRPDTSTPVSGVRIRIRALLTLFRGFNLLDVFKVRRAVKVSPMFALFLVSVVPCSWFSLNGENP